MSDNQAEWVQDRLTILEVAGGLRAGMKAAMEVMQQNNNAHNYMPKEVTNEMIDNAARDASAVTLNQKNDIVKHTNNIETERQRHTRNRCL